MAFRRFRKRFGSRMGARRRARWDMQEYKECERIITVDNTEGTPISCQNPLILADLLASMESPAGGVQESSGLDRALIWGGCKGQIQYSVQVTFNTDSSPPAADVCNLSVHLVTAIVRLPLNHAVTPATPLYLPNLLLSKSQLSTVFNNQSDNVESVLWRREEILRWGSFTLNSAQGDTCWPGLGSQGAGVITQLDGFAWVAAVAGSLGTFGRTWGRGEFRERVRRRLDERQGIFLVRCISLGAAGNFGPPINVATNSWIHYALRRGR